MKNEAIRYSIPLVVLLFLMCILFAACAQPTSSPPSTPTKPPVAQPPDTIETQPPEETPPVNQIKEEEWYTVETFSGKGNKSLPPFHINGNQWRIVWTIDVESTENAALDLLIYFHGVAGGIWKTLPYKGGNSGNMTFFVEPGDNRDFFIMAIARNLQQWTIAVEDNATAPASCPVQITYIRYRGTVYPPDPDKGQCYERVEPDEYVVIKNLSESSQKMGGWVLKNLNREYPTFIFPLNFVLGPGEIIRVYTNEIYPECSEWREFGTPPEDCTPFINLWFTFNYGTGGIWDNENPDVAVLYDASGEEISRKSYAVPTKSSD